MRHMQCASKQHGQLKCDRRHKTVLNESAANTTDAADAAGVFAATVTCVFCKVFLHHPLRKFNYCWILMWPRNKVQKNWRLNQIRSAEFDMIFVHSKSMPIMDLPRCSSAPLCPLTIRNFLSLSLFFKSNSRFTWQ